MKPNKFILKLTLKLELFTHLIPVPIGIYFSAVASGFKNIDDTLLALGMGTVAAVVVIGVALVFRIIKVKSIFKNIPGPGCQLPNPARASLLLLHYPYFEVKLIILRWALGVPLAHLGFVMAKNFQLQPQAHMTIPYLLFITIPISAIVYLFITEDNVRPLLQSEALRNSSPPAHMVRRFGYFRRLLATILAVTVMPFTLMGYFLYATNNGIITLSHPLVHIGIMVFLVFAALVVASFVVARAVKGGLSVSNNALTNLGNGLFDVTSLRTSADDFGDQSYLLSIITEKLRAMYEQITSLNENLEHKVQVRTEELAQTLGKVQELKTQQDGDYFLTSLLLKPLAANTTRGNPVTVDFLIRQKKRFEFRVWKEEIGGDICIAHSISLKKRPYTVFLNADAMGKSIQGAGGALVLGAVFQSIIERTRLTAQTADQYPERWMKNSFVELQKVFESFDGTMLVSMVLGMVEDETGLVYFMNAEHPPMVLFRQNQASFIDAEYMFHKLGTQGLDGGIYVRTFQMKPGDVIIAGSDGRDDLNMARKDGEREINENEQLFLSVVNDGAGQLTRIEEVIHEKGELTDDFSLLRIGFHENEPQSEFINETQDINEARQDWHRGRREEALRKLEEIHGYHPEDTAVLRLLVKLYINIDNYEKAAEFAEKFSELHPADTEMMFVASHCLKKARRYDRAIDSAERVRLREPSLVKNLVNLAEMYLVKGNQNRSRSMIAEVQTIEPENSRAKKILEKLPL